MFLYNNIYYADETCKVALSLADTHGEKITFHEDTEIIGKNFAKENKRIKEVVLPDNLEQIEDFAFAFSSLKNITFPKKLNFVGDCAFKMCSSLEDIDFSKIQDKLYLGKGAFRLSACKKAILPDSLEVIGPYLFADCANLKELHIGKNTRQILKQAFRNCSLEKITVSKDNVILRSENNCVLFDDTLILGCATSVIPKDTKIINHYAFAYNQNLEKMDIPEGVMLIQNKAFANSSLEEINLPNSLNQIMAYAFCNTKLKKISIPNSVRYVGDAAFSNNEELEEVKWTKKCKNITFNTFSNCSNLKKITNIEHVQNILPSAFTNCTSLDNINLGEKLETIEEFAFEYCSSLRNINLPYNKFLSIDGTAFTNSAIYNEQMKEKGYFAVGQILVAVDNVEELVIEEGIKKIEDNAAFDNQVLKSVSFPSTLIKIDSCAFLNCLSLENIKLNEGLAAIEDRAFSNTSITHLSLPSTLFVLGTGVFRNCVKLSEVDPLSCNIVHFGEHVFDNTALTDISFLKGNEVIPMCTFRHCSKLKYVSIPQSVKTIMAHAFDESGIEDLILHQNVKHLDSLGDVPHLKQITYLGKRKNLEDVMLAPDILRFGSKIKTIENLDELIDKFTLKEINTLYKTPNKEKDETEI